MGLINWIKCHIFHKCPHCGKHMMTDAEIVYLEQCFTCFYESSENDDSFDRKHMFSGSSEDENEDFLDQ